MYLYLLIRQHIIPVVLTLLVTIITFLLFVDIGQTQGKTITKERISPYVLSTQGKTIVKSGDGTTITLDSQQKKNIETEDKIRTLANSSATIFWSDGSVTRLGEKTNISVLELKNGVNDSTQVDFSISEGKSWSNLGRTMDPDSYFKQRYDNNEKVAAVRGTVFEINVEKGYLHTESHAVTIQDEKWWYLDTVPDGMSIATDWSSIKAIDSGTLDPKWQQANIENDAKLMQERLQKIQDKLKLLQSKEGMLREVQIYLRQLFGVESLNLPINVESSGSGISLSIDSTKLTSKNAQELLAIYEAISVLNTSDATVDSKIKLREAILKTLPEKEANMYREIFSRATLYDIWDSIKNNLPKNTKELQGYLETYTKQSENTEEIKRLQESLPLDRIKAFNSRMDEWKSIGFETLSDPDWFSKTFKVDTENLIQGIDKFNNAADDVKDSIIKKISN